MVIPLSFVNTTPEHNCKIFSIGTLASFILNLLSISVAWCACTYLWDALSAWSILEAGHIDLIMAMISKCVKFKTKPILPIGTQYVKFRINGSDKTRALLNHWYSWIHPRVISSPREYLSSCKQTHILRTCIKICILYIMMHCCNIGFDYGDVHR